MDMNGTVNLVILRVEKVVQFVQISRELLILMKSINGCLITIEIWNVLITVEI